MIQSLLILGHVGTLQTSPPEQGVAIGFWRFMAARIAGLLRNRRLTQGADKPRREASALPLVAAIGPELVWTTTCEPEGDAQHDGLEHPLSNDCVERQRPNRSR